MDPLTLEAALEVWEHGRRGSTTRRALALLRAGSWEAPESALESLPLGERDRRLLELRAATFGPRMTAVSRCPHCGEEVEVTVPVEGLLGLPRAFASPEPVALTGGPRPFRLPTSEDLLAAEAQPEPAEAQQVLALRCLRAPDASAHGGPGPDGETPLSEGDLKTLAQAMAEADPLAEVLLELECAACGGGWQEPFEIAEFLFQEVEILAHRLLQEVSVLARGYGWREAEILAMSPERRQAYRELLEA